MLAERIVASSEWTLVCEQNVRNGAKMTGKSPKMTRPTGRARAKWRKFSREKWSIICEI